MGRILFGISSILNVCVSGILGFLWTYENLECWRSFDHQNMSGLSRELVFLILQFLDEEKFKETVHKLEKESGFFFNMGYLEDMVTNGEWDELEKYLSGFIKVDDNSYSKKIFFEIRKQKFFEALDKQEHGKAVEILANDLKVFSTSHQGLYKQMAMLFTLKNFRENEHLSCYGNTESARAALLVELKKLIKLNPLIHNKLQFPTLKKSRLRTLINHSLNWQHQLCLNPKPNPDIKTIFYDHTCGMPKGPPVPSTVANQSMIPMPKVVGLPPIGGPPPFQDSDPPTIITQLVLHQTVSAGPVGVNTPNNAVSIVKCPRGLDYQTADSEQFPKRSKPFGVSEEITNLPGDIVTMMNAGEGHAHSVQFADAGEGHAHSVQSADDLPKTVVANLNQGSAVNSMDFHPVQLTMLLVGTNSGDVSVWEVDTGQKLASKNFKVWDLVSCSMMLHVSLANEYTASVNRVIWSPDGKLLGVAYSKHIIHLYSYNGGNDLGNHLEIDAHVGNVNDLAFSNLDKRLCIISCGEDKTVKVWDAASGDRKYTFEGHEAPVYCVCPCFTENIQFVLSSAVDGKIKVWFYDNKGSRVDYDAPGHCCTTMAFSTDGSRLFSCGTNKDGKSYIVEWETNGSVKRTFAGLGERSVGLVQFDTTKNRFLAAGGEFVIKYWDMDNVNLLTTTDAGGGLPASPCLRFSKEGLMLAVSTNEDSVKILANAECIRLMHFLENRAGTSAMAHVIDIDKDKNASAGGVDLMNVDGENMADGEHKLTDEVEKPKVWEMKEISGQSELCSLRLPDILPVRIVRLTYTNAGGSLLALPCNGVHKLWKWHENATNAAGKATTAFPPQLWKPSSGILMRNDINDTNPEAISCFALSKNESYVISASGGKISLFSLLTFKTLCTFMAPPPAATFLAFHPQDNNVIAIGMQDTSIQIYDIRTDKVKRKLKGHRKRVTGLAFSNVLNVLVSTGADAWICVWSTNGWKKKARKFLQIPAGRPSSSYAQTRVQFHQDHTHILVVHETQIATYEALKLEIIKQWVPRDTIAAITDATYSCDSQSIYACFEDGSVCVFTATGLEMRCSISPTAYLPSSGPSSGNYPLVIIANPSKPNQFALGFADGEVHVLEPLETEGEWGPEPPLENAAAAGSSSCS